MKRTSKLLLIMVLSTLLMMAPSLADVSPTSRFPWVFDSAVPRPSNLNPSSFSYTDIYTGSMIYSYEIKVPPGTNGLTPSVKFIYNSQDSLGLPSYVGGGWRFSENYIKRNINYTVVNKNDDYFQLMFDGSLYDLVYVTSENRFHTKIESFFYIETKTGAPNSNGTYWILKTKDGTTYRFGYNSDSELVSNQYNFVSKWYLDFINDTYTNGVFYQYKENPFGSDYGATYLNGIMYNNDKKRIINFTYETSDRPDLREYYDQGNKIRYSRRLKNINITLNSKVVNTYLINHQTFDDKSKSAISNITLYGSDSVSNLPPLQFGYYTPTSLNAWSSTSDIYNVPSCSGSAENKCFVDSGNLDQGLRFIDMNADGLMDLVRASLQSNLHQVLINDGSTWNLNSSWTIPYDGTRYMDFVDGNNLDNGVRMLDVNGDGFPDVIFGNGRPGFSPYTEGWISNGNGGWTGDDNWKLPDCTNSGQPGCFIINNATGDVVDNGIVFADVNGDGLPDLLRGNRKTGDNIIYLNTGHDWQYSSLWKLPVCSSTAPADDSCFVDVNSADSGVRTIDLNGDGLSDLVRGNAKSGATRAWLNNGTGWVEAPNWNIPNSDLYFVSSKGADKGVRIVDLNGDGLSDLIKANGRPGEGPGEQIEASTSSAINNGNGWDQSTWVMPSCDYSIKLGCFLISDYSNDNGVRLADVNGDGFPDILRASGVESPYVTTRIANVTRPYLLSNITNEFGGFTTINYISSASFARGNETCYSPQSVLPFNIWLVANKTNIITYPTSYSETESYSYSGRSYNYTDKEFRGFCSTKQIRPDNSIVQHWFYQDVARQGKELKNEIYDSDNKLFKRDESVFDTKSINGYFVPLLNKSAELTFDGSLTNPKIKNVTYGYDEFGNTIVINNLGDFSVQSDEKFEYYEYLNNSALWIVDKPKRYYLLATDNLTVVRQTWYKYDNLNYNVAPIKGDITQKSDFLDNETNITTSYIHDSYGNIINETNPQGYITQYIFGLRDTTYTFVDRTINARNHVTDYSYDLGTGNVISKTDSNSIVTNYTYDVFGRIEKEILPYDSFAYPTKNYTYDYSVMPVKTIINQRESSGTDNTLDSYYFYDGFGRLIQTKEEAENGNQIVQDTYYDKLSRVNKQSNPYIATFSTGYSTPDTSVSGINYSYDALNRIKNITNPDNTKKSINYDHWIVTAYDENNHKKTYYKDAYENTYSVLEHNGIETYNTSYYYDAANQLITIKDSQNDIFNFSYDNAGRLVKIIDPDTGIRTYKYDLVGNPIRQVDNNSTTTLSYDQLNRLINKNRDPDEIRYTYDSHKNGTIFEANMSKYAIRTSQIRYNYDDRLRMIGEIKIMDNIAFNTSFAYDAMDRIISMISPDGFTTIYSYNLQGQLASISSILNNLNYNEKSQVTSRNYSNNLNTSFKYNTSNFRLNQIRTGSKQDLNYTYDNIGNVIQLGDSINSKIESMTYDDLDRLISSIKKLNSGLVIFNLTYNYNSIGNIMNLTSSGNIRTFSYGTFPVHAPVGIIDNT